MITPARLAPGRDRRYGSAMVMLSGWLRRTARTRPAPGPAPRFEPRADGVSFTLAGEPVEALIEGALFAPGCATLIVSDLHLEKGSARAHGGTLLPPYDTRSTLAALTACVARRRPRRIVSLGDSFHDEAGPERLDPADRQALAALIGQVEWVWIEGNHDHAAPGRLGGSVAREIAVGALRLRHEPLAEAAPGEVAGHLHPCARVVGQGRSVRRRCFATDGGRLVMPAFGAFTGGLNLLDAAFAPLFPHGACALMLGREAVYPAGFGRLAPD